MPWSVTRSVLVEVRVTQSKMFEYGRCPCGGTYDRRTVEVRLTVEGKVVVLTDISQGACPQCGSRVYKADVLEDIENLLRGESRNRRANEPPA